MKLLLMLLLNLNRGVRVFGMALGGSIILLWVTCLLGLKLIGVLGLMTGLVLTMWVLGGVLYAYHRLVLFRG